MARSDLPHRHDLAAERDSAQGQAAAMKDEAEIQREIDELLKQIDEGDL